MAGSMLPTIGSWLPSRQCQLSHPCHDVQRTGLALSGDDSVQINRSALLRVSKVVILLSMISISPLRGRGMEGVTGVGQTWTEMAARMFCRPP
jgi:hypothetical protein